MILPALRIVETDPGSSDENVSQEIFGIPGVRGGAFPAWLHDSVSGYGVPHVTLTHMLQNAIQVPGDTTFGPHHGVLAPPSAQRDIVHRRKNQVRQKHGQITPPSDSAPKSVTTSQQQVPFKRPLESQQETEENAGREREHRARHAANQRHSKSKGSSKKTKADTGEDGDTKDAEDAEDEDKRAAHRARNRQAASKCRTKKKAQCEEQEEDARQKGAENRALKAEEQALRNMKSQILGCLLDHQVGTCNCTAIHRYNIRQAQNLVFGAGGQNGQMQMSPSTASAGSAQTPDSEMSFSMPMSSSDVASSAGMADGASRAQSFSRPLNYTFAPVTTPEMMQATMATAPVPSTQSPTQMPQDFTDFLQGSPGVRGFSYQGDLDFR